MNGLKSQARNRSFRKSISRRSPKRLSGEVRLAGGPTTALPRAMRSLLSEHGRENQPDPITTSTGASVRHLPEHLPPHAPEGSQNLCNDAHGDLLRTLGTDVEPDRIVDPFELLEAGREALFCELS